MVKTLKEIADFVQGELYGNGSIKIKGVAEIEKAQTGELTFLSNPKYKIFLERTKASAVIIDKKFETPKIPSIRHDNPYYAFCKTLEFFTRKKDYPEGVHPSAILGKNVKMGRRVHIGAYVVIQDKVSMGDRVTILSGSFVGENTVVGEDSFLYPGVTIRENCEIGKKVILHSGAVIGSDGFGYAKEDEIYHKIPQTGRVILEDYVEIGANTTIDRATLGETRIGKGTKIDNLVQIAHNVSIGENSVIAGQAGISGSTKIGKNVTIAGQVGIIGHIKVGDNVIAGAQSGITKSVAPYTVISGYPAREHKKAKKIEACISLLPFYVKKIRELEKKIKNLERKKPQG
ncbi:MAG: UDP-3-O-(3-hydroxymyristoyl)glucosamine N-acyltransferase [candidate division Zixibacteria bacterium]|nr:UDP-3-O-(3-hydroxymyristoyl)glucosamine N-acyltransferase [candidate division Zixibacteria bacterium]